MRAGLVAVGLFASGCTSGVYSLDDIDPVAAAPLLAEGFTHGVSVDTPVANIAQIKSGEARLFRIAAQHCGLPRSASADDLKFKVQPDIYFTSYALFACTQPEKVAR